jgi:hypothetical protein
MILKKILDAFKKEKETIGKEKKDKIFTSLKKFKTEEIAIMEFERSKSKLFDVSRWSDMPGITSTFKLFNWKGEDLHDIKPSKGDYIYIKLPGPLPENWVTIIAIEEQEDFAEFIVSPSPKPQARGKEKDEIEHFFVDEATSTFRINREGDTLFAYEIGKDEWINNQGKEAANREWINTLIAAGGWMAFQKIQWEKLTDYLVHEIEIEE